MKQKEEILSMAVRCGSWQDSFEKLGEICDKEMQKLIADNKLIDAPKSVVVFWTSDLPAELICEANVTREENGKVNYTLDFAMSTL